MKVFCMRILLNQPTSRSCIPDVLYKTSCLNYIKRQSPTRLACHETLLTAYLCGGLSCGIRVATAATAKTTIANYTDQSAISRARELTGVSGTVRRMLFIVSYEGHEADQKANFHADLRRGWWCTSTMRHPPLNNERLRPP